MWGSLTPEGRGEENPQPDANTPQAVTCQPGLLRTTPWLLHTGAYRSAPQALPGSQNSPHCVLGPCGHQTHPGWVGSQTRSRWALATGGHMSGGRQQPSDGLVGLFFGFASALGSAGYALGTPKP